MKPRINPFLRTAALAASIVLTLGSAGANQYQWGGATSTDWATGTNWTTGTNITAGPAPTGATAAHRLNVQNGTGNKLVYTSGLGTTTYANTVTTTVGGGGRGLAIGNGTKGELEITGGTFSTFGSPASDVIGNGTGATAILTINGGTFIGAADNTSPGTGLGIGGGPTCTLNVLAGSATVDTLNFNNTTGTINLSGGTLSAKKINKTAGTGTLNLSGGTLKARQSDTAFVTGLSAVNVNSAGAIIDTNSFDVTIGNALRDGGGGLTKNSGGTLTLTGVNTYTGPTVINGGTLALSPATALTYNGNISGAGSLTIGGAGTVTLGGTNTYGGATNVNSGGLNLNGTLTSNVTVASGANLGGEGSTTGSVIFSGASVFSFSPSTPGAFTAGSINATGASVSFAPVGGGAGGSGIVVMQAAGGITGTIGTEFIGNSRVSLSYNIGQTQLLANYTPGSLVWKGTDGTNPTWWDSAVTANWDHSGSPDTFIAGDSALFDDTASSFTVAVQGTVLPGTVTFSNTSPNTYVISSGVIGGAASIIKNGSGTLNINTANTYTGTTSITNGSVIVGNNAALGDAAGGTSVSGTGVLDINGYNLGTEVVTIAGNGSGAGALINSGAQQINALGRLVLSADATIGASTSRWDLRNSTPTLDLGGHTLTKTGGGYVALVGVAVSNPGNIDIAQGTLSLQTTTTMGGTSANTVTVRNGATLDCYQGGTWTPPEWSMVLEDGSSLSASNGTAIWNGPISGGALTKTGTATLALAGNNTYTGLTSINAGSLVAQNANALGTTAAGTNVASGARLELDNTTITGEAITIAGTGGNFWGPLQGRSGSSVWTGNVTVAADQTRIGAQAGSTLEVSGVIDSGANNYNVTFRPADSTAHVIVSGANTYIGSTSIIGGVVSVSSINSVSGGSPASNLGAPTTVADGTIQMSNGATGTLSYTGTGETTDRVINLQGTTNGAYLDQSGTGLLKFTSDLTATGVGSKTLVLQGSTTGTGELAGAIVNNDGTNITGLAKAGTGTWTLSGNNTFTGGVTINGGVLRITNSNALGIGPKTVTINASANKWLELDGSGGNITLTSDFSFQTSGVNGVVRNTAGDNLINGAFTMTVGNGNTKIISDNAGSLTLNGNIAANTTTRVLDLSGDSVANNAFNGVLSNASSPGLSKSGTGKWILNGVNLYTGATTITGGTLVLGSTGSIAASTSLSISASAKLDTSATTTYTLPGTVSLGLDGDSATSGLIDATGKELVIGSAAVTFNVTGTLTAPVYVLAKYATLTGGAFSSATAPTGYILNYAYNGGTQIALVKTAGYDSWATTNSVTGGPNGDDDSDGISNLVEYALGLNPHASSGAPGTLVGNVLTYLKGIDAGTDANLIYSIETSTTLAPGSWTTVTPSTNDATKIEYTLPTGVGGRIFARLNVVNTP